MKDEKPCIVFTGGGTAGHIFPGIAIIEHLRQRLECRIVWIGSKKDSDRAAVESRGIEFFAISSGKFRRDLSLKNFVDIFKVFAGALQARKLLKKLNPVLVFSKGGYVSVPPSLVAAHLGIPLFTHESDLSPGLATKINAKKASKIFLSWEKTLDYLPEDQKEKALVTGNPVRIDIFTGDSGTGRNWLGFTKDKPVVLVLGGSQGAMQINNLVCEILPELSKLAQVAHQTGRGHSPCQSDSKDYKAFEFVNAELPHLLAAADIIISRAGAGSLWEGAAANKPMILIPLTGAGTRGDQKENAMVLSHAEAAICLADDSATSDNLFAALNDLISNEQKRRDLAFAAHSMIKTDAAEMIAKYIIKYLAKK